MILWMEEVRRSPVEVGSLSYYLQVFIQYIPGGPGFLPSTVACSICLFHTTWTPRGSIDVFWLRYFIGIK